jgi:hypothetical protein
MKPNPTLGSDFSRDVPQSRRLVVAAEAAPTELSPAGSLHARRA